MSLYDENEITEHSQQVGRLYRKVRKGYTAGKWVAQGIENIIENLHNVETRNNAHTKAARLQLILFSKDIGAF